ncbi:3'-5' exonuclease, partial [Deinococcus pimensis]|uniref:3'-5' exonuclease n=1 Tax=Deinococcus pimensis TaxID=309888 RepID=UPI0005EB2A44
MSAASADVPHPWLDGEDPTTGIVSVHADARGDALVWRRVDGRVTWSRERFRPFVFARHLDDLAHVEARVGAGEHAEFGVTTLTGDEGSLRFLVHARSGVALRRELLAGASRRLGRPVGSLHDLRDYHVLGPVEQYLSATGRTYFKGMTYADLARLQFDLETTSLDPEKGRIFMASLRDNAGHEVVLEAPREEDERRLLLDLMAAVRARDPDVLEGHNVSAFDLPFLLRRAEVCGVRLDLSRRPGPPGVWRAQDGRRRPH